MYNDISNNILSGSSARRLNSIPEIGDVVIGVPVNPSLEEIPEKPKTLAE